MPKLGYLQAICKEAFWKHLSAPLNLPRIASQACEVNGCYIPKNTRLSVNIRAIGRDPDVWENALDFHPDRFLSGKHAKLDPPVNDFELFHSIWGLEENLCWSQKGGSASMEYVLGTLVHSFDWKLPAEVIELNMEESFGLAVPLKAKVGIDRLKRFNHPRSLFFEKRMAQSRIVCVAASL
ncbi:flavonoid 3',5'-hydroxylase 2-like [Coffea eugenioides]|uniref:flavonoid 3',5'-hydroxylase 2-like n=1 Tax=Coffea eugenioides TaxID=49369 RepID=UPI000F60ADA9|nr:flavonoid 3',5'-hydroxylase 2-like [Coffea eugenioides]